MHWLCPDGIMRGVRALQIIRRFTPMRSRPLPVTVGAILLALFSLMNFPGPWWYVVPGVAEVTPMIVIYSGIVLGIAGIVGAVGLWMLKTWSLWLTVVVCVLNILLNVSGLVMVLPGGLKALITIQTIGFVLTLVLIVLPSISRVSENSVNRKPVFEYNIWRKPTFREEAFSAAE